MTGINLGDFGKGYDGGKTREESFYELIRELERTEGIERYRISSIEPNLLTNEIIEFVAASQKFMPHFHIPLQSGSDAVLQLMQRRYDTALFRRRVEKIRTLLPHAFIGVDVIVGVRGETDAYFEEACQFIDSLDISNHLVQHGKTFHHSQKVPDANTLLQTLKIHWFAHSADHVQ